MSSKGKTTQQTTKRATTKRKATTTKITTTDTNQLTTAIPAKAREGLTDLSIEYLKRDAEYFSRLLESQETHTPFWSLFNSIFTDMLLNESGLSLTRPDVLRILYPLVMIEMGADDARTFGEVFTHMVETLIPSEVSESVRVSVYGKGGAR